MICKVPQRQGMPPLHSTQTSETMLAKRACNMLFLGSHPLPSSAKCGYEEG